MSVAVWAVMIVLVGHWLADFVWQPHWMSMRKSKEWKILALHALRITAGCYLVAGTIVAIDQHRFYHVYWVTWWALLNGGAHFAIDAVTSRVTSRLYQKERIHDFFVVIGFDQLLHVALAVATLSWLLR